jgi:hypothetical protein
MSIAPTCHYDAPPDAALAAVRAHGGPVLVDLDETLYLRNSTDGFFDFVRSGLLGLMLLRVLEVLTPWRLTGGIDTRDTWRVYTISTFSPWTHRRWRAKVQFLADCYVNHELRATLKARAQAPMMLSIGLPDQTSGGALHLPRHPPGGFRLLATELDRPSDQSRQPHPRRTAAVTVVLGNLRARLCR